jgi:DNA-binding GntR family transcriptional regulator
LGAGAEIDLRPNRYPISYDAAGLTSHQAGQMILADRAYAELRARILDLRLRPDQIVPDLALAAELGMSRATIHDALARLHHEGLVEPLPRRGFAVTMPTVEAMREIYEIVGALEGQCVRRAARDGGAILLAALEAAITAQEVALANDDLVGWARADYRFHELLREGGANGRLREIIRQFDGQLQRARAATIHLRAKPRRSTDDHQEILSAIRGRDEDEAVRVHHAHRRRADAEMLAAIRAYADTASGSPPRDAAGQIQPASPAAPTAPPSGAVTRS